MNSWLSAYRGTRVLLTGHTGFKGGWLALWLRALGAEVTGYSLPPVQGLSFFESARVADGLRHIEGDVRDLARVQQTMADTRPAVVFHLAAQALVRESYRRPHDTITTNVIGTLNVLEAARANGASVALVMITSDKCYENLEWNRGYTETDVLGGRDPYSGSKAAAEILISSYRRSFFNQTGTSAASVRAGNVIGGGDWSADRVVPDAIRALTAGQRIGVRNPHAVRPWQHVLEPLSGYLQLGARMMTTGGAEIGGKESASQNAHAWNFGPTIDNTRTVGDLVSLVVRFWGSGGWDATPDSAAPHEATLLRLDISKAAQQLGWAPRWSVEQAVQRTVAWYRAHCDGADMANCSLDQIAEYESTPIPSLAEV